MNIILLIYWILTTIYGTYWLVKHPSDRRYEDDDEFDDEFEDEEEAKFFNEFRFYYDKKMKKIMGINKENKIVEDK